jgi:hypothetical protein
MPAHADEDVALRHGDAQRLHPLGSVRGLDMREFVNGARQTQHPGPVVMHGSFRHRRPGARARLRGTVCAHGRRFRSQTQRLPAPIGHEQFDTGMENRAVSFKVAPGVWSHHIVARRAETLSFSGLLYRMERCFRAGCVPETKQEY